MMQEMIGIFFVEAGILFGVMLFVFPALKSYAGRALYFGILALVNLMMSNVGELNGLKVFCALSMFAAACFLFQEISERREEKRIHEAKLRGELRMF